MIRGKRPDPGIDVAHAASTQATNHIEENVLREILGVFYVDESLEAVPIDRFAVFVDPIFEPRRSTHHKNRRALHLYQYVSNSAVLLGPAR